ncbi:hypothetical protein [Sphingomonas sp.]|uniref:hypothetical protein n=1 Tax=Sphingomonas sp. TaxID=28214 RepID=UPI003CC57616
MSRPILLAAAATAALATAGPALAQVAPDGAPQTAAPVAPVPPRSHPRTQVRPYIELSQTVDIDLKGDDAVTYTSAAAGVDASIDTARTSAQLSYRYEHRFGYQRGDSDVDVHSGLARAAFRLTPELTLEGGALATRTRSDIRGEAPGIFASDNRNVSQLYSVYAGPTLATRAGSATAAGLYRIGYTKVDQPGYSPVLAGQPRTNAYDHSVSQVAGLTVGLAPRVLLPVGLTASAGWEQERSGALQQHYDSWFVRDDALLPVSETVALTAGVGYERVKTSERAPLLDGTGAPVIDARGRFAIDDSQPRRVTYRTDGIYYDAGVVWRPSPRTSLEGHVGRRYGSMSYTGVAHWAATPSVGVGIQVYDQVTTFGRQLRQGLAALPTSFVATRDQFAQAFTGCTYGNAGATPGGCLNSAFQSVTDASYRARGVDAVVSATRGHTTYGAGVGYANRKLYAPDRPGISIYGVEDESYYGQVFLSRALTPVSGVDLQGFADYYEPAQAQDVLSVGATATYYHDFGRLGTTASIGVYHFRVGDGIETSWRGQALVGARYTF